MRKTLYGEEKFRSLFSLLLCILELLFLAFVNQLTNRLVTQLIYSYTVQAGLGSRPHSLIKTNVIRYLTTQEITDDKISLVFLLPTGLGGLCKNLVLACIYIMH